MKITDTEETEETEKGQRDGWTDKTSRYPVNVILFIDPEIFPELPKGDSRDLVAGRRLGEMLTVQK